MAGKSLAAQAKTQVFLAPEGDHLPHPADPHAGSRADRPHHRPGLRLNEDLTEAIALAHDLASAPFGSGEVALNGLCQELALLQRPGGPS